jgi:hypothetical protein
MATLDRHLTAETHLVVFGSAALLLDPTFSERLVGKITNDVDLIIPSENMLAVESDKQFWAAQEKTNRELEPDGLYLTHIFPEEEIVLAPEWKTRTKVLTHPTLRHLRLMRPDTCDLIVSKMGRGDAKDIEDVKTMLQLEFTPSFAIEGAANVAHVPECYREIFPAAKTSIINVARALEEALFEKISKEVHMQKSRHALASSANDHPVIAAARHRARNGSREAEELLGMLEALKKMHPQQPIEPLQNGPALD